MAEDLNIVLKRDNHPIDLALKCYQLLLQEKYVDVTLSAQGGALKAHRLVLSSSSDYFTEVLSHQPPDSHVIIVLDKISFNNLKLLIEYIYNGKVTVSQEELPALMEAASGLKIKVTGLLNESYRSGTDVELLGQGALESAISLPPSLAGSRVPLPVLERAASSLQNNDSEVTDRSGYNDGPSYTSDQNQHQDSFVILDQDPMLENHTTAFPIGYFVSTSNASDPKERGPEEEDPFGETGIAENGALMDWENTNDLGENAEAHQLLANVEIIHHPLNNTNPPAVLLDMGVRVLPEELKKLKAEYLLRKAAKEQDLDRPKRITVEKSWDTGTEVASEYDESADSSIYDAVNLSPDYSTDDEFIISSKAGRNNEGEEEQEEETTEYDAEKEMDEASSSEDIDSDSSDEDFAAGSSSPAYPSRSKDSKPSSSTKIIQPNKMSAKGSSTQQKHQHSFKCDKCLRTYKRRESLRRHTKLECGKERKFRCTVCDRRFGQKISLQKHLMKVHNIDRSQLVLHGAGPKERPVLPFPCTKQCGRSFKSKPLMNRHSSLCGEDPAFHCHHCNYRSKWKCDLDSHILYIHGVEPSK